MVDDRAKSVQLPADTSIHSRVEAELTRLLFRLAGFGLFSNFALALILSAGLTAYFPISWSLVWLGAILVVSLGRWLLNRRFALAHRSDAETAHWRRYFSLGATVAGAVWGAAAWIFLDTQVLLPRLLVVLIIAGMNAGAARS